MDFKFSKAKKEFFFYGAIALICLIAFVIMKYFHIVEGLQDTGLEVVTDATTGKQTVKGQPEAVKTFMDSVQAESNSTTIGNTKVNNF
jgi:hypothetical protein